MRIATLKKRVEFERIRGGGRWSSTCFVLEGKMRPPASAQVERVPRFGFTISKKVGQAVVRNRIRRRLRAALTEVVEACADPRFDYVIVARAPALDRAFCELKSDLAIAFQRVHAARKPGSGRRAEAAGGSEQ